MITLEMKAAASRLDEAAKRFPANSPDPYAKNNELSTALSDFYTGLLTLTQEELLEICTQKDAYSESASRARSIHMAVAMAEGIYVSADKTKGKHFFASEFLADGCPKNYDPWKGISTYEGKKSERPFVQYQDDRSIYLNRAACSVCLIKREKFTTEKLVNLNLDTYEEVEHTSVPAGTNLGALSTLEAKNLYIPVYPWKRLVYEPYFYTTAFQPLDPKKIMAAFDGLDYKHKEKIGGQYDRKGEPTVILLFGGKYAAAFQWGVLCQFLKAAAGIGADIIATNGASKSMMAENTTTEDIVSAMPLGFGDADGPMAAEEGFIVIEMEDLL